MGIEGAGERRMRHDAPKRLARTGEALGDWRGRAATLDHGRDARHEDGRGVAPPSSLEARRRLDDVLASSTDGELMDKVLGVGVRSAVSGDDEGKELPPRRVAQRLGGGDLALEVLLGRLEVGSPSTVVVRRGDPDVDSAPACCTPTKRGGAEKNISRATVVGVGNTVGERDLKSGGGVGGTGKGEEVVTQVIVTDDAHSTAAEERVRAERGGRDVGRALGALAGAYEVGDRDAEAHTDGGDVLIGAEDATMSEVGSPDPVVAGAAISKVLQAEEAFEIGIGESGALSAQRVDGLTEAEVVNVLHQTMLESGARGGRVAVIGATAGVLYHLAGRRRMRGRAARRRRTVTEDKRDGGGVDGPSGVGDLLQQSGSGRGTVEGVMELTADGVGADGDGGRGIDGDAELFALVGKPSDQLLSLGERRSVSRKG
jgi:hypothetical protein